MAHHSHRIPWDTLASNFEYVNVNPCAGGITNLFPRFKDKQGDDLNAFVDAFASATEEDSACERRKYPKKYDPPDEEDLILSDETTKTISSTMRRVREDGKWKGDQAVEEMCGGDLCQRKGDSRCGCPVPYEERKASSFLRPYNPNDCYQFFEQNGAAFFNLQLVQALVLHGEMDPVLRICSRPEVDYLRWWSVSLCECVSSRDVGWEFLCKDALNAYVCLNLLYCFPELGDAAPAEAVSEMDYRRTKGYQEMLRLCTLCGMTTEVATFPHRRFFGISDDQFNSWPEPRAQRRWGPETGLGEGDIPYGYLSIDELLTFERLADHLPSPWDVAEVRWLLCSTGLPVELAIKIMDFADYIPKRQLEVPHDPLHQENSGELTKYLEYCWKILIRCDMWTKALGDQISWDTLVSRHLVEFWGFNHKEHENCAKGNRYMCTGTEENGEREEKGIARHECCRDIFANHSSRP